MNPTIKISNQYMATSDPVARPVVDRRKRVWSQGQSRVRDLSDADVIIAGRLVATLGITFAQATHTINLVRRGK